MKHKHKILAVEPAMQLKILQFAKQQNDVQTQSALKEEISAYLGECWQNEEARTTAFEVLDAQQNYQATIDAGQVNIHIGLQPVKPWEFWIIEIQQMESKEADSGH